ncbi:sensor histidine kinase [Maliponia aquimaris]|uniref:histidine kinase n=1 Tax=Maliponia aquimaris TaxID=1673631 RepID=A0A238L0S9_9RHOB|nr:sensor histidine kinase [Maliponia aquimaris]SMX48693.1 putative sensor histidine kinase pdtaS [Maliponia aquimaris]
MRTRLQNLSRWSRSLSARIVLLMTLAVLPVGLIAVYQTMAVIDNARALNRTSLMAQIRAEASKEEELIQNALAAARGLSVLVARMGDEACDDILRGFVEGNDTYILAGFVSREGMLTCSSRGEVMDLSDRPAFRTAITRGSATVQMLPAAAVTGRDVVLVTQPVSRDGVMLGYIALSIPHAIVVGQLDGPAPADGLRLAVIDSEGKLLAATNGLDEAPGFLPAEIGLADLPKRMQQTFRATAGSGETRVFAVTPMIEDTVLLVGSWPLSAEPRSDGPWQTVFAIALPVLMWVAGVGVALYGMQQLVIRHVADLRSAMRRFALGERDAAALALAEAPAELEEAQRAFNRMALLISEGEARREQDLKDKEVLLREVHHRVKNNLQLIASMMNLQARDLQSDEARHVVAELQRRVRGMAVLHRALYNTPTSTTVDAAALVQAVVTDVRDHSRTLPLPEIDTTLEPVDLYPDQAVPLSLLLAETLNTALCDPGDDRAPIRVGLSAVGDNHVRLSIEGPAGLSGARAGPRGGVAQKMLAAFLRQLDGTMETDQLAGRCHLTVTFPRASYGA